MAERLLLALTIVTAVTGCSEVCYNRLGCFTNCPPYGFTEARLIGRLPWDPEVINTRFLLFTRECLDQYEVVSALNVSSVLDTHFKSSRTSAFVIHGFVEFGEKDWLVNMCQALLQVSDINCFSVDWKGGSFALYTQASNNVRVVGAEIAYFSHYLQDTFDYSGSNIHLIGHSLGAQVAGEAGKRLPGLGRISALDAAGPYFDDTPPEVRLGFADASFVDAIHTDTSSFIGNLGFGGYGMSEPIGHVDFYPNGGEQMPGCDKIHIESGDLDQIIEGLVDIVPCNHQRSFQFFRESILKPDGFVAYPASSYNSFKMGSGFPCANGTCALMGYYSMMSRMDPGSTREQFYLNTGDVEDFPRWRYKLSIYVSGPVFVLGSLKVSLCQHEQCTHQHQIHSGLLHSDGIYSAFIDAEKNLYPVKEVVFSWTLDMIDVLQPQLGASMLLLQYGPDGETYLKLLVAGGGAKAFVYSGDHVFSTFGQSLNISVPYIQNCKSYINAGGACIEALPASGKEGNTDSPAFLPLGLADAALSVKLFRRKAVQLGQFEQLLIGYLINIQATAGMTTLWKMHGKQLRLMPTLLLFRELNKEQPINQLLPSSQPMRPTISLPPVCTPN
ncbi:pancreatic lipase-related protein 2-like [Gastrophryne carolinensis]